MKTTENPIAVQSQKWLVSSLLDLMNTQNYSKITIKDLAKHADLDRRTFYRNFQSKEDVLCFYIRGMCDEYIEALSHEQNPSTFLAAKTYFSICRKHLEFFNLLLKQGLLGFLLLKFDEFMPSLQQQNLSQDLKHYYGEDISYLYAFNNGGFWNMSIQWIRNGSIQTPEEMANIVCKIVHGMSECGF
ncbi:TetR/AcrR family transcriptional regulator [Gorillibacterium timonense]|uniref:TetR/AcrR family transcriptional regulator n=1 Tax=Gorillibacterium timonense TaxID=1689269 RepID=UPI00071C67FB|nr:TetR/AcrR family transcriptional regulator [Gorillibacterium timonense]